MRGRCAALPAAYELTTLPTDSKRGGKRNKSSQPTATKKNNKMNDIKKNLKSVVTGLPTQQAPTGSSVEVPKDSLIQNKFTGDTENMPRNITFPFHKLDKALTMLSNVLDFMDVEIWSAINPHRRWRGSAKQDGGQP